MTNKLLSPATDLNNVVDASRMVSLCLELGLSWQPESLNALHAKSSHWFIFDMSSGVKHGNDVQVIFDLEQT